MIVAEELTKTFPASGTGGEFTAVDRVSFQVPEGEFFTLLGPSGCGKTTTLRCIAGLERPDSGAVRLADTVVVSDRVYVPANRRDVGMVFQSYAVWPHLTVFDNAAFPLSVGRAKLKSAQVKERVRRTLELVGLQGLEERKPTQLSGGQQQRLSLARALVHQPSCLLFDEPLSNLDAKLRERMRAELREIQRAIGFTALYVTHDQTEALSLSDAIAVMHQGQIIQQGTPQEIYYQPANRRVAEFIGASNIVAGTIAAAPDGDLQVAVDTGIGRLRCSPRGFTGAVGADVLISLRPEDVRVVAPGVADGDNRFDVTVRAVTFGGAATELAVEVAPAGLPMRIQHGSRRRLAEGDRLTVAIDPAACHVLPASDGDDGVDDTDGAA